MISLVMQISYTISPLFLIILIGYIATHLKWLDKIALPTLSSLVYYIMAPAFLIDAFSRIEWVYFPNWTSFIAIPITMVMIATLGYWTAKKLHNPKQIGVISQASFRPNTLVIGLPLSFLILGEEGLKYATFGLMLTTPLSNTISVFLFTYIANQGKNLRQLGYSMLKVILNPLIISSAFGVLLSLVRSSPDSEIIIIDKVLQSLKVATFPIALINVGAVLHAEKSIQKNRILILPLIYKLILSPTIVMLLMFLMGADSTQFIAIGILFAAPVASISYVITSEFQGDAYLSATLISYSTIISFFSYQIILFILASLKLWQPT